MRAVDGNLASSDDSRKRRKTSEAVRTPLYRFVVMPVAYALFKLIQLACRVLPPGFCYLVMRAVALAAWYLRPVRRRLVLRNLDIALGDKYTEAERRRIGRQSVQHFFLTGLDLLLAPQYYRDGRWRRFLEITPEQVAFFESMKSYPGPVAFCTGHFGSWEVGHATSGLCGGKLALIYRPLDFAWIEAEIRNIRGFFGNPIIPKKGALRSYMKMMKQNGWIGVIADQNAGTDGGFVSFFGVPVSTEVRHFLLFQRFPTKMTAAFVQREGLRFKFRFRAFFETEIRRDTDERTEAMRLAQWYTDCVQRVVEEAPEQYDWLHRRFRSRPPGAPSLYENLGKPLDRALLQAQPPAPIPPAEWSEGNATAG
ncbi:MAG: hypothetical protein A3K19_07865 [Lentisphaerae bacterium RIFOXYB12_FULL_65_16]|nr:MAG: hypothetical protein A3K18_31740 [Lentisphaerae bacterium RIFOXYA12_64_32]OGV87567.1 MAG: hypothetical protein A3K19_07865 [Lentisphaerae bacterium RIFOXYB12_FULL_65_16]